MPTSKQDNFKKQKTRNKIIIQQNLYKLILVHYYKNILKLEQAVAHPHLEK